MKKTSYGDTFNPQLIQYRYIMNNLTVSKYNPFTAGNYCLTNKYIFDTTIILLHTKYYTNKKTNTNELST